MDELRLSFPPAFLQTTSVQSSDTCVVFAGAGPRGPHSHSGHQPHPGQQRIGASGHPFIGAPAQPFWQQPPNREQPRPSLARTASAVEQELLGRSRPGPNPRFSSAMPIPISVLLAAGRNVPKQPSPAPPPPATSEELGLIEDDEIVFKGR
jgi:hypothetical protein